ncbi:MAG: hypothetical protein A4E66_02711 [Syntrophus sp. PtaB.Bin001]|nr:MAG: hypothetical protein A4E66_02711 [Syntrophus sp. PtaB.Bin001]
MHDLMSLAAKKSIEGHPSAMGTDHDQGRFFFINNFFKFPYDPVRPYGNLNCKTQSF